MARLKLKLLFGLIVISARVILIHGSFEKAKQQLERDKQARLGWPPEKLEIWYNFRLNQIYKRYPREGFKEELMKLDSKRDTSTKSRWELDPLYEKARDELREKYPGPAEEQDITDLKRRMEDLQKAFQQADFALWFKTEKDKIHEKRRQVEARQMEALELAMRATKISKKRKVETEAPELDLQLKQGRRGSSPLAMHGSLAMHSSLAMHGPVPVYAGKGEE